MMVTYCDPPDGWRYGFPKPVHEEYHTLGEDFDLKRWLINEGYPEQLTQVGWFYCRFWQEDVEDDC